MNGLSGRFAARSAGGVPVSGAAVMVEEAQRLAVDGAGRKLGRWPKRGCGGARVVQLVPGHADVLPVGLGACGGALG
jgi:hypothetical protein